MGKHLMAVAAHCDDIEFLMAGTMLKCHEKFGYGIVYVQSTNNMSGEWCQATQGERAVTAPVPPAWLKRIKTREASPGLLVHTVPWYVEMAQRKKEAADSAREFFHTEPLHLDYPQRHYTDGELKKIDLRYGAPRPDCVPEDFPSIVTAHEDKDALERMANLILEKDPEVIMTHAPVDYTEEHTSTSHLVRKAFLKAKAQGYDGSLVFALTVTSGAYGEFFDRWDAFVDITGFEDKKRQAIGTHACQVPFPERLDLEDCLRGKICGVGAAEVFHVFELSGTRSGELADELGRSHAHCRANWSRMFFSPESEKLFADFREECARPR